MTAKAAMTFSPISVHRLLSLIVLLLCFFTASSSTNQCESNSGQDSSNCLTSDNVYSFKKECNCQPHSIHEKDGGARIAYLISLHNQRTLDESLALLKRIVAPGFIVLIHVDTKFPKEKWIENNELMKYIQDENCNCCGATVVVESHFDCKWGTFSMLDPTLWGK